MKKALKKYFKISALLLILLFVSTAGIYAVKGWNMYKDAVKKVPPAQMAKMLRGENYVTIDELPEFYTKAVICTEDRRFYEHGGVDPQALARAITPAAPCSAALRIAEITEIGVKKFYSRALG